MAVKIKWRPRVIADEQRIYRSATPFAKNALPLALAVVDAGASEYHDETAPSGDLYYRVSAVSGAGEAVSDIVQVGSVADYTPDPAYRYWRLLADGNQGAINTTFAGVQMFDSLGGQNVCSGGTVIASSALDGVYWQKENAFSSLSPRESKYGDSQLFFAASETTGAWVGYDFGDGNEKAIVQFAIVGRSSGLVAQNPSGLRLQYSSDAITWFDKDANALIQPGAAELVRYPPGDPPYAAHKYWRVQCTQAVDSSVCTFLAEVELLDASNVNQSGTAIITSDTNWSGYPASNVADGSITSGYSAVDGVWGANVTFEFAAAVDIRSVRVTGRNSYVHTCPRDLRLMFSDDGTTWTYLFGVNEQVGWSASEVRTFS